MLAASLILYNNRSAETPPASAYSESLEKAIRWVVNNKHVALSSDNPMLWWMIKESAELTGDSRLHAVFSEYKARYLDPKPGNAWWHLFDPASTVSIPLWHLEYLPDYNLHLLYGASCNRQLLGIEVVRSQNEIDFCARYHPFSPACLTHQMMALRFMQRRQCANPDDIRRLISALQDKIVTRLIFDPRIVDVYIQRVLMLVESGAAQRVSAAWIWNILDAQYDDGGWGDFHPWVPVDSSRHLGFAGRSIGIRKEVGDFHTTAQGILLMSLLVNRAR